MTAIRRTMLHHIWKVTAVLAAAFGVAVLSSAAPASADTLINQPPARVCHHHTFTVGVWAQPGTPWANRRYVVNVYNPSRVRVQHHAGHAPTSAWRYWHPEAWKLGYYHTIYTTWKNGVRYRTRLATHTVRC